MPKRPATNDDLSLPQAECGDEKHTAALCE